MANPQAVGDDEGEWIEVVNADATAVNLRDWVLRDAGSDRHRIAADLWLQPGDYAVLGIVADPAINGGAPVHYAYRGVTLANRSDALVLELPDGRLADSVRWGEDTGLATTAGASLERTSLMADATWTTAQQPWPGSAGGLWLAGSGVFRPADANAWPDAPRSMAARDGAGRAADRRICLSGQRRRVRGDP
jgi:hypothetical protein